MKRDLRDVIPSGPRWRLAKLDQAVAQRKRKATNDRASLSRGAATSNIVKGDRVIIKVNHRGWKFRTPFVHEVLEVMNVNGSLVTARRKQITVTRNISRFKLAASHPEGREENTETGGDGGMPSVKDTSCD